MKEKREFEPNPKTPLDDWDESIDPAIMSGDHWAAEENAPLEQAGLFDSEECEVAEEKMKSDPAAMFMHPYVNVSYGNDSWTGTAPDVEVNQPEKKKKDTNKDK